MKFTIKIELLPNGHVTTGNSRIFPRIISYLIIFLACNGVLTSLLWETMTTNLYEFFIEKFILIKNEAFVFDKRLINCVQNDKMRKVAHVFLVEF